MKLGEMVSIKFLCFIILAIVFFTASFHLFNVTISNETLGIAIMMLLLALFADLKKFNFWGLTGEKAEEQLKKLEGKSGVNVKAVPKPSAKEVLRAETVTLKTSAQKSDSLNGNFLTVVYDLERLMRLAATVIKGKEPVPGEVQEVLKQTGLIKEAGIQQLELVRRIKNLLIQGRDEEIDDSVISGAMKIAANLYKELNQWLLHSTK